MMLIGVFEYLEARRIRAELEERGVRVELISNPMTCSTGGCKPTVELHAPDEAFGQVTEFMREEKDREMAGLEYDPSLSEEVYDSEKSVARCPACGTQFSTLNRECPDCGLVFAT